MTPNELRVALAEGISAWLRFEHHAGREELFCERYLALPIAQILQHCVSGKVTGESEHPILTTAGGEGRPPQLDFLVTNNSRAILAVESKWAAKNGVSISEVLWDCIRLELAANHYDCEAVFILAGTRNQVDKVLKSPSFNTKNSRMKATKVLNLHESGKQSVKINSFEAAYVVPLHKELRNYPNILWPSELVCGRGTQDSRLPSASTYTAVVWHITPAGDTKRRLFHVLSEEATVAGRKKAVAAMKRRIKNKKVASKIADAKNDPIKVAKLKTAAAKRERK